MIKIIKKLGELSWLEWKCLVYAFVLLPVTGILLANRGFNKTIAILRLKKDTDGSTHLDDDKKAIIHSVVRMVSIASHYSLYHPACLPKSIVICWLLHRHHIQAGIKFGVHTDPANAIDAHAWVEHAGQNISDSEALQQQVVTLQKANHGHTGI